MLVDKAAGDINVTSTLGGNAHAMGIDAAAMSHIMNVLTDLYSDPEYAVLREYSTNALDAQIEAGVTCPIEVELPSPLSPFLKVRDYGIGLTESDIATIYSRYGASTKRGTNDQVGMLGLGCKSALTYVSQFTIVSVKDGKRVQVAVSREAEGGSMTVVDQRDTDEANGTEITIPAKRGHDFEAKARKFFRYWKPGTVLVNGDAPERVEGLWLNDKFLITGQKSRSYYAQTREHVVVMGNVPYPVDTGNVPAWDDLTLNNGFSLTVFVDIGSVDFVPSREALSYTSDRTKRTLKDTVAEFEEARQGAIQRAINAATSKSEAVKAMCDWHDVFSDTGKAEYKYKGKTLPLAWTNGRATGYNDALADRILVVPRKSHVQNRCEAAKEVRADLWAGALWVTGYEGKKFSASQKQKLVAFIDKRKDADDIQRFIMMKDEPAGVKEWINKARIVKWEDVNKVKLDRSYVYGAIKTIPGSYDNVIVDGQNNGEVEAKNIDQSKPLYYYSGHWYHMRTYARLIAKHVPHHTIVPLPDNRKGKFLRNFPAALELLPECEKLAKAWAKALPLNVRKAIAMHDKGHTRSFKKLDARKISDPALKESIRLAKIDLTQPLAERKLYRDILGDVDGIAAAWTSPLVHYPLFDQYQLDTEVGTKHTYIYLNAAHKAR